MSLSEQDSSCQFERLLEVARTAGGIEILEASVDPSQPAMKACLDKARAEGLRSGLQGLREYRAGQPRAKCIVSPFERRTVEQAHSIAKETMQRGCRIGKNEYFPLNAPIDWAADRIRDRGRRFHLNAWIFLEAHIEAYCDCGAEDLASFARQIALDWIEQCIYEGKDNEFAWYDMAVGERAFVLAVLLDEALRNPEVSDDDVIRLLAASRVHAAYLHEKERIKWHSNHGIFQLAGLMALSSTIPELQDSQQQRQFAEDGLVELYTAHFTQEGIHKEHSPHYHVFLTNLLGLIMQTGWLRRPEALASLFKKATSNVIWMVHPDGTMVRVGDTDLEKADDILLQRDEPVRYALSGGREGEMPQSAFAVFPGSGCASFRSPWDNVPYEEASFLFFSAAFHSRMHKHADDFTFEWSELGRVLVCDSGRGSYNYHTSEREYAVSTRAHNTVEIDNQDYSRRIADAFGSALKAWGESEHAFSVEAEQYRKRGFRTHHNRILVFMPGEWLAVIDRLCSPLDHVFTQWFHFDPELHLRRGGLKFRAVIPRTGKVLLVTPLLTADGIRAVCVRGQQQPCLQGWTSLEPNTLTPNYAVGYSLTGKEATFVTVFRICGPTSRVLAGKSAVPRSEGTCKIRWFVDGREEGFDYGAEDGERRLKAIP